MGCEKSRQLSITLAEEQNFRALFPLHIVNKRISMWIEGKKAMERFSSWILLRIGRWWSNKLKTFRHGAKFNVEVVWPLYVILRHGRLCFPREQKFRSFPLIVFNLCSRNCRVLFHGNWPTRDRRISYVHSWKVESQSRENRRMEVSKVIRKTRRGMKLDWI